MKSLLTQFYYYGQRVVQKVCGHDFVIPFGRKSRVLVSTPPGGTKKIAIQRSYSGDLAEIISLLSKGDTYIDVGANFGHYTLGVHDHFDGDVDIHCFEPEYDAYRRLLQNRHINRSSWSCLNLALSDSPGWLQISSGLGGYNHVTTDGSGQFVKSITLDSYIIEAKIDQIDVLKIDVEGFEIFVLKGCKHSLEAKKVKSIIFEVDGHQERYGVDSVDEYQKFLAPLGYSLKKENENYQLWGLD